MGAGSFNLKTPPAEWAEALASGDRRALSRLLTFAESSRSDQQKLVDAVLALTKDTGAFRIGISGAPGAGKSTLLEALGTHVLGENKTVGVLTIDPTSQVSGGSILGDKTRMTGLSSAAGAFVRPSPSGVGQAGISSYTSRSLALCDRAGFDYVFLETVGVGQTELEAVALVDCFLMVVSPSGGDELQGMKRGITEHADILVVNKLDQDPALATRTCSSYASALRLIRGKEVPTLRVSAKERLHIDDLWGQLSEFCSALSPDQRRQRKQREQQREFWRVLMKNLEHDLRAGRSNEEDFINERIQAVLSGAATVNEAARQVVDRLLPSSNK